MELTWYKFNDKVRERMLESISEKPLYRLRLKDGREMTAFVHDHALVRNTFNSEKILVEDILEYAVIGENHGDRPY